MRITMIAMMDPQFTVNGLWNAELEGTSAVPGYRLVLRERLNQMLAGVRCDTRDSFTTMGTRITYSHYNSTSIACADVNTGLNAGQSYVIPNYDSCGIGFPATKVLSNGQTEKYYTSFSASCVAALSGQTTVATIQDSLWRKVRSQMPIFEVQSMIDTLYHYTHPSTDLTAARVRIPAGADPNLCLDVKWGNSASGTPVWLWGCTGNAAQQWSYDRKAQTIKNTAFGKCLQVRQLGLFGIGVDNYARGATAEIADCLNPPPLRQQWTYDPQGGVVQSALNTVLDIQWNNLSAQTPVWLWDRNGGTAQQWRADLSSTYCSSACIPICQASCASAGAYVSNCMLGCMPACSQDCTSSWPWP